MRNYLNDAESNSAPVLITDVIGADLEKGLVLIKLKSGEARWSIAVTPHIGLKGVELVQRAIVPALVTPIRKRFAGLCEAVGRMVGRAH